MAAAHTGNFSLEVPFKLKYMLKSTIVLNNEFAMLDRKRRARHLSFTRAMSTPNKGHFSCGP